MCVCSFLLICFRLALPSGFHRRCVVLARKQDAPSPASKTMPLAHNAESLAAIGARSADASRAWLHNRLGRADVEVSCLCPAYSVSHISFAVVCSSLCSEYVLRGMRAPWDASPVWCRRRSSDSLGICWPRVSARFVRCSCCVITLLDEACTCQRSGRVV